MNSEAVSSVSEIGRNIGRIERERDRPSHTALKIHTGGRRTRAQFDAISWGRGWAMVYVMGSVLKIRTNRSARKQKSRRSCNQMF